MKTLPLNTGTWDLVLDAEGDWVMTDPDSSVAQDVASAVKTFLGEAWYDTTLGMPYFQSIFGQLPPASLVTARLKQEAFTIADVQDVTVVSLNLNDRLLTGALVITTDYNAKLVVNF